MTLSKETIDKVLGLIEELEKDREFFAVKYEDLVEETKYKTSRLASLEKENTLLRKKLLESDNLVKLAIGKVDKLSKELEGLGVLKSSNRLISKIESLSKSPRHTDTIKHKHERTTKHEDVVREAPLKEKINAMRTSLDELV